MSIFGKELLTFKGTRIGQRTSKSQPFDDQEMLQHCIETFESPANLFE